MQTLEQRIIGQLMQAPRLLEEMPCGLTAEMFTEPHAIATFSAILRCAEQKKQWTLFDLMENLQHHSSAVPPEWLIGVMNEVESTLDFPDRCLQLYYQHRRVNLRRQLATLSDELQHLPLEQAMGRLSQLLTAEEEKALQNTPASDIIRIRQLQEEVHRERLGQGDKGYDIGYGPLTDHRLRLSEGGGLCVVTGVPNSGKTDWLRCTLAQLITRRGHRAAFLSFEEPNKAAHVVDMMRLQAQTNHLEMLTDKQEAELVDYLDRHVVYLQCRSAAPTARYITRLAERAFAEGLPNYLIIDPYLYVEPEGGRGDSETERIKHLLTYLHEWSVQKHVWTFIVAHPKKPQGEEGTGDYEELSAYSISGSAHWANVGDFVIGVRRCYAPGVSRAEGTDNPSYTRVEVMKVRDQKLCHPGHLFFLRNPTGQYREVTEQEARQWVNG